MSGSEQSTTHNIRLPVSVRDALSARAQALGLTISEVIRRCDRHCAKHKLVTAEITEGKTPTVPVTVDWWLWIVWGNNAAWLAARIVAALNDTAWTAPPLAKQAAPDGYVVVDDAGREVERVGPAS